MVNYVIKKGVFRAFWGVKTNKNSLTKKYKRFIIY